LLEVFPRRRFITGGGYCRTWARLHVVGIRASPGRTQRLKGAYGLLAPCHRGKRPGKQHTITTETAELIRQGVTKHFGAVAKDIATELQMRNDNGSNSMSNDFQKETTLLGIKASPSFVRAPKTTATQSASSTP
jgi:hypothetical protein